ncbi:hypothetical protein KP509_32G013700 [Ceratopteris richardii]|uniref:Uncharacterized protein n=1 Tax=Ceratopteris richardii TaxID=49495 RepID=A0A8T2QRF9_CERRI|nr:hypothetical protein KP509_32G013700 [Ceratopteris richardii]
MNQNKTGLPEEIWKGDTVGYDIKMSGAHPSSVPIVSSQRTRKVFMITNMKPMTC